MPSRYRVRGPFRRIVRAIAIPLARKGVRPDTITYFSLFLALIAALSLTLFNSQVLFAILVFLAGLFDGVDGTIARLNQTSSKKGSFSDSIVDKVAEMLILISIAVAYPTIEILGLSVSLWVILCVFGWLMTSYTRARAEGLEITDLDVGLGGRSERLLTLVIFSVVGLLLIGLVVVTILGLGTASYRVYHYKQQLSKQSGTL
ncbi:MAG: CDP-alcohol phosphatidyltransferase family protein [Candidatus Thorarchaeota archaeon]